MATRSISVTLNAVTSKFQADMMRAKASVQGFSREVGQSARKNRADFDQLGKGALVFGGALAFGLGKAVGAAMDFEKSMSGVQSVANASAAEMRHLSDAALKAGADVTLAGVTASSAAKAEMELVKAGVQVSEVLGGALKGSLSLAVAGQLDMADAATIAAQSMNLFKLNGAEVGHVADVLAAGANKSAADVGQLGDALRQGGLLAAQTGLTLEETVGTLSAFADRALIGSDAGTSLKTMLMRLVPSTTEAQELMEDLGFSAFNASGEFIGMSKLAGQLQESLAGMSTEQRGAALNTLFGQDAIRGANVLFELGADGVRDYTDAVNDQGAASRMAAIQTDNLAGDIEALGGAWESLTINLGENAQGPLRSATQRLTGLVNAVGELPESTQDAVIAFGTLGSATALASGAFLLLAPRIVATKDAIAALNATGTVSAFAGVGKGAIQLYAVSAAANAVADSILEMTGRGPTDVARLSDALQNLNETGRATGEMARVFGEDLHGFDIALRRVTDPSLMDNIAHTVDTIASLGLPGNVSDIDAANRVLADMDEALARLAGNVTTADDAAAAFEQLATQAALSGIPIEDLKELLPLYTEAARLAGEESAHSSQFMGRWQTQSVALAESLMGVTDAAYETAGGVMELTDEQKALQETIGGFIGPLGVYQAELERTAQKTADETKKSSDSWTDYADTAEVSMKRVMRQMEDEVRARQDWGVNMLDLSTRVSDQTMQILTDMGPEAAGLIENLVDMSDKELRKWERLAGKSGEAGTTKFREALEEAQPILRHVAEVAGEEAAEGLIKKLRKGTATVAEISREYGSALADGINPILASLGEAKIYVTPGQGAYLRSGNELNSGGYLDGPRTHRDTVPAMLTPGEFVQRESAVDYYGVGFMKALNDRRIPRHAIGGYNSGGFVNRGAVPQPPSLNPYGPPVSTPAHAANRRLYESTADWVEANVAPPLSAGIGWEAMWAVVARRFPGLAKFSDFRPGSITATGNPSYHGMGRAIDISPRMDVFSWLAQNYRNSREIIFSPANGSQIWNGQNHMYGEPTRGDHWDHIHWAMNKGGLVKSLPFGSYDNGGFLPPGLSLAHNGLGVPEPVGFNGGGIVAHPGRAYSQQGAVARDILNRAAAIGTAEAYEDALAAIEAMQAHWAEIVRLEEAAAEKATLIADVNRAERSRDTVLDDPKASKADKRDARNEYRDAKHALLDFMEAETRANADRAVARAEERASRAAERAANRAAREEERQAAKEQREQNIIDWKFSRMTAEEQLADVQARLDAERRGSDEWLRLMNERRQLRDEIHQDELDAIEETKRAEQEAADEAARAAAEAQRAAEELNRTLQARTAVLAGNALAMPQVNEGVMPWDILANLDAQMQQRTEWAQGRDRLAGLGLSMQAMEELGITAGPQALDQVRKLLWSNPRLLGDLNDKIAENLADAAEQAIAEQNWLGVSPIGFAGLAPAPAGPQKVVVEFKQPAGPQKPTEVVAPATDRILGQIRAALADGVHPNDIASMAAAL